MIKNRGRKRRRKKSDKKEKKKPADKKSPAKKKEEKVKEKLTCPFESDGLTFGKDFDQYDTCDDCEIREECEVEKNNKSKPEKKKPEKEKPSAKKKSEKKEKKTGKKKENKKAKKMKCPVEGLTFKDDYDGYEDCDSCEIKIECGKAAGKLDDVSECPHGHTFGEDCNQEDECDELCQVWDACQDLYDEMND